jgi:RHS repeat-associated protein
VNGGDSVAFQYDKDGLLKTAGGLSITRDPQNGRIAGTTLGGVTTGQAYNNFGELESLYAVFATDTLFKTIYAQDSLGRIEEITETIQGQTRTFNYSYDQAGRLREVSRNDTLISVYAYDANGNRLSHITPGDTVSGSYDDQDRLLTYGTASYTYTRNGELSMKIEGTDSTQHRYDAFGNLISVRLPDSTLIEYVIDGQNRRVGKKVNGVLAKKWLYQNQLNIVAELDSADNVVSRFVYGTRPNVPDYMIKGGVTYRIIPDHLGSVRLVVNRSTGTIAQRIDCDEFGNTTPDTDPGFQPFWFAGGLYDKHTKLIRFGARVYDSETGRWAKTDPIRFAGGQTNLYVYVSNNPINLIDPSGLGRICNKFGGEVVAVAGRTTKLVTIGSQDITATFPAEVYEAAVVIPNNRITPLGPDWDFYGIPIGKGKVRWYKVPNNFDVEIQEDGTPKIISGPQPGSLQYKIQSFLGWIPRDADPDKGEPGWALGILQRVAEAYKVQQCMDPCK